MHTGRIKRRRFAYLSTCKVGPGITCNLQPFYVINSMFSVMNFLCENINAKFIQLRINVDVNLNIVVELWGDNDPTDMEVTNVETCSVCVDST